MLQRRMDSIFAQSFFMESYQAKVRQIGRIEPDSFTKIRVCTKCETEIKKDFKYDWG